eukprot:gene5153-5803_t
MKNRVDPRIPLVKVLPNNATIEQNGVPSNRKINKKGRSPVGGQFSVSNNNILKEATVISLKMTQNDDKKVSESIRDNRNSISIATATVAAIQAAESELVGSRSRKTSRILDRAVIAQESSAMKAVSKWRNFVSTKRQHPMEKLRKYEIMNMNQLFEKSGNSSTIYNVMKDKCFGFLKQQDDGASTNLKRLGNKTLSTRRKEAQQNALIGYFVTLADKEDDKSTVDYNHINKLLDSGADINVGDKYGQTVLHEVARIWHTDVAQFVIQRGAHVDAMDMYGRTPLHVAAAVDYTEMVNFLISKQADINARTKGENQTPIHYAAKNDACNALTALIDKGASLDDRDYKGRTPLQVAAELDRSETCKILLKEGAPAGVCDDSGMSAMALMIMKMPPVALTALDQFHVKDRANRKQYFYLNYLETPQSCPYAKSCLKVAVEKKQYSIIMHPVMQRLTEVKWNRFGKTRAWFYLVLNLIFCILWTTLLCTSPHSYKNMYSPLPGKSYRIGLEILAACSLVYWFVSEYKEYRASLRERREYLKWRESEMTKEFEHCHPRWPEERAYLEREITELLASNMSYFVDWWNYFDWLTYISVIATLVAHAVAYANESPDAYEAEHVIGSIMLILQWLRLMKFVRAFHALGPFVVILNHVASDTARFAFLFFEFYIPFSAAAWILFGRQSIPGYSNIEELFYNLLQITVIGDYGFSDLAAKHGRTARLLCGTYIVLSGIVCLNLFIALLSDTFQRVYDNAKANAQMLRSARVLSFEDNFSKKQRKRYRNYIDKNCSPERIYYDDDMTDQSETELKRMTHQIKQDVDRMNKFLQTKLGEEEEREMEAKGSISDGESPQHYNSNNQRYTKKSNCENTKDLQSLTEELKMLKSNYEHSMKIFNIQLLSMNSMLAELSKRKKRKEKKKKETRLTNSLKLSTSSQSRIATTVATVVAPMPRWAQTPEGGSSNMAASKKQ